MGLSPIGKAPGKAWADGNSAATEAKAAIAAPIVDHSTATDIAVDPSNYKTGITNANSATDKRVDTVTLTGAIPLHSNGSKVRNWAGIGVNYAKGSHYFYAAFADTPLDVAGAVAKASEFKAGTTEGLVDGQCKADWTAGTDYSTFYFNAASSKAYFVLAVANATNPADANICAVYNVPVSGSSTLGAAYAITSSATDNGSISDITYSVTNDNVTDIVAGAQAGDGETVTVTVAPGTNYTSTGVTYTYEDEDGDSVTANATKQAAANTYAFTMPASDVTLGASFESLGSSSTSGFRSPQSTTTFVATVGGSPMYYDTLANAVSDLDLGLIAEGSTMQLYADAKDGKGKAGAAVLKKDITIDLNGKELAITSGDSVKVQDGAQVTVLGSASAKAGKITSAYTNGTPAVRATGSDAEGATALTIQNVSSIEGASTIVKADGGAKLVSTGSDYTATTKGNASIIVVDDATFELPDGTITVSTAATGASNNQDSSAIQATEKSVVTIGSPTVTTVAPAIKTVVGTGTVTLEKPAITINGGTYTATSAATNHTSSVVVDMTSTAAKVAIKGGSFKGRTGVVSTAASSGEKVLAISGGTFEYTAVAANNAELILGVGTDSDNPNKSYSVTGGTFKGVFAADTGSATFANAAKIVTGGTFESDLTQADTTVTPNVAPGAFAAVVMDNCKVTKTDATSTAVATWAVSKDMSKAQVKGTTLTGLKYTALEQEFKADFTWNGADLKAGKDYTVSFYAGELDADGNLPSGAAITKFTNAGKYCYAVTPVEGSGFSGSLKANVPVAKADLGSLYNNGELDSSLKINLRTYSSDTWTPLADYSAIYAGGTQALTPAAQVFLNDVDVTAQVDVSWNESANKAAVGSKGKVFLVGKADTNIDSDNAKKATVEFDIVASSISTGTTWNTGILHGKYEAAPSAKVPKFQQSSPAVDGEIYINALAGTTYLNAANCTVTVTKPDKTTAEWDGTSDDTTGNDAKDGTNIFVGAGTYKIKFEGRSAASPYLSGTFDQVTYVIDPCALDAANFTGAPKQTYDGQAVATITAAQGKQPGGTLTNLSINKDYTADPFEVSKAGTFTVTVNGINNYTGTFTKTVEIEANTFDYVVSSATSLPYNGEAQAPTFKFYKGHTASAAGVEVTPTTADYDVKYQKQNGTAWADLSGEPTDVGAYKATFTPKNGFAYTEGTTEVSTTFSIDSFALSGATLVNVAFTDAAKRIVYAGTAINPNKYVDWSETYVLMGTARVDLTSADIVLEPSEINVAGDVDAVKFTVSGLGNYKGSVNGAAANVSMGDMSIEGTTLAKAAEITGAEGAVFNGDQLKPAVTVKNKITGNELVRGTDYTVMYTRVKDSAGKSVSESAQDYVLNAGTYEVAIVSAGLYGTGVSTNAMKYSGTIEVAQADIAGLTVKGLPEVEADLAASVPFTGVEAALAIPAGLTVDLGGKNPIALVAANAKFVDKDSAAIVNVGEYEGLVLAGQGNLKGSVATLYKGQVAKATLSDAINLAIEFDSGEGVWTSTVATAKDAEPAIRVLYYYNGKTAHPDDYSVLTKDVDYKAAYTGNNAYGANAATVTVTASDDEKANVGGAFTATATYSIASTTADSVAMKLDGDAAWTYDATTHTVKPVLTITSGGVTETLKASAQNVATGDYTVVVKKASDGDDAVATTDGISYSGDVASVSIKDADTYTITAVGKTFVGKKTATVEVSKIDLSKATKITGLDEDEIEYMTYTGTARKLTVDDATLQIGKAANNAIDLDLDSNAVDVSYENNVNAGTATMTVSPAKSISKNYENSFDFQFGIAKANLRWAFDVVSEAISGDGEQKAFYFASEDGYEFTGKQARPAIQVVPDDTSASDVKIGYVKPVDPSEYTVDFGANTDVTDGVIVIVTPVDGGNYTGYATGRFDVNPVEFNATNVTVSAADQNYDGKAKEPVVAKYGDYQLKLGSDYAVEYENNTNVGTATAKLTARPGVNNYGTGNFYVYGKPNIMETSFKIQAPEQTINASNKSVAMGKTVSIGASSAQKGAISYSTKDTSVVSVNAASGVVTPKKVGTATITVTAKATADGNYRETAKDVTVTVTKGANTMTVTPKTAKVSYKKLKKKNQTLKVGKVLTVSKAIGNVTYVKKSGSKKITINKNTGKVTVKKGTTLKKGKTYKVKVAVTDAGNANYNGATVTKTFKVKVTK